MGNYSYRTLFNNGGDVVEIIIRDSTGKTIEKKMANLADKEEVKRIFKSLREKYNIEGDFLSSDSEFFKF